MSEEAVIRVAALTSGKTVPSRRFRVEQHIERLSRCGILVDEFVPAISKWASLIGWPKGVSHKYVAPLWLLWQGAKLSCRLPGILGSWTHHITWLQKEMLPGFPTLEGFLKKPLVFDVDDAIWLWPPWGGTVTRFAARRAAIILAGNAFLADWLSEHNRNIRIVPTAIDTDRFHPPAAQEASASWFTIGWTGHSSSFPYLETAEKPLLSFLREHRDARFLVVADEPPEFSIKNPDQMVFVRWDESNEAEALRAMDVGLMPLSDGTLARGKCSLKMLQYMACGMPVIVSPIGMNKEVLSQGEVGIAARSEDDWYDALRWFYCNRSQGREFGRVGRSIVERHYSQRVISQQLADTFRELC